MLCLAATKTVMLCTSAVEPLIALSIVAVGVDTLLAKPGGLCHRGPARSLLVLTADWLATSQEGRA
jgi:hypothetical protein